MKFSLICIGIFLFTKSINAQIVIDPPCAGSFSYLGIATHSGTIPDEPLPIAQFFEICPTDNYSVCGGNAPCGLNYNLSCTPFAHLCANQVDCGNCQLTNCPTCIPSTTNDTVVMRNVHKLHFYQNNYYNHPLVYQDEIDLGQRCFNKDFGIKCTVAAEGTASTVFDVTGPNPSSIGIRPAFSPLDSNKNGYLYKYYVMPDVESYGYYAPNGFPSDSDTLISFEVFDVSSPDWVLATFKVKKVKVPVLMVHGINSDGSTWDDLKGYLSDNGYEGIINTPSLPKDSSFQYTYPKVAYQIDSMLNVYREDGDGININQVDVLGHSMGGILGRYHIQSSSYSVDYANVNKLITINTPHAGSEIANYVYDSSIYGSLGIWLNALFVDMNVNGGALENLRVNSSAITFMNSQPQLENSKRTFIHSISCDWEWCAGNVDIPLPTLTATLGQFNRFAKFSWNLCPTDFLLGSHNDGIVSLSSQKGGLSGNNAFIFSGSSNDYSHLSLKNSYIHEHILQLLKLSTKSDYFTRAGFNPPVLSPPAFLKDPVLQERALVEISIDNLHEGDTIIANGNNVFNVTGTSDVAGSMVMFHHENGDYAFDSSFQSSHIYPINIPSGYTGTIDIGVLGTNGSGTTDFKFLSIYVKQQALPIELIRFQGKENPDNIQLDWTSASELNSSHFDVMHSTDGFSFKSIARVNAAGTTNQNSNYQYKHYNPDNGINYYRLKQIDTDATYSFSNIISVNFKTEELIHIVPNPTSGVLTIQIEDLPEMGMIQCKIINELGQPVFDDLISNGKLDISMLAEGVYFLQIEYKDKFYFTRLLKE